MLLASSCSMDRLPEGSITDEEALQTLDDYKQFSNGIHSIMRSVTSGDFVVLSDIQLDDYNAIIGNGNRRMDFYNGQMYPATGEVGSIYAGMYTAISQCNFMLDHAKELLPQYAGESMKESKQTLQRYMGQALFARAYCYSTLADLFCRSYKNSTDRDKEGTGLSLQLVYNPTADRDYYPGRSSLDVTYKQIIADLVEAVKYMEEYEATHEDYKPKCDNPYISSDAAKAMLARVYLNMGMNEEAIRYATKLIESKTYNLLRNRTDFYNMWRNDKGNGTTSETIWLVSADYQHHGSATGAAFCNNEQNPDYVPNNDAIYLFDENDTRWYAWFDNDDRNNPAAKQRDITISTGASASLFQFAKYPGNPELQDKTATSTVYVNMAKPLRISEMYLIAAEAYADMGEDNNARKYLMDMEVARNAGGYSPSLSGSELMDEIRNERHREFMGEGRRIADLKRWNIGCKRSDAFDGQNDVIVENFRNLEYKAGDYRLTWPIPQHELDSNPQIAGQQNPGY